MISSKNFDRNIDYISEKVASRGWEDKQEKWDDFSILRSEKQYFDTIACELYENYFLPKRHEFEWAIISDLINEIITSTPVEFIAVSIAGGVIGDSAYDLIRILCRNISESLRKNLGNSYTERSKGFEEIAIVTSAIEEFYTNHSMARIAEIERGTGFPREKIYPLLKLAGFKHHRRETPCYWEKP